MTMSTFNFSSIHGPNIIQDEDKSIATWKINKFYGICVTNRHFATGDDVELHLSGRGHVYVGITPTNLHDQIQNGADCATHCKMFYKLCRLKNNSESWRIVHKGHHAINVTHSEKEEKFDLTVPEDSWLCIQMAFGDIKAEIKTQGTSKKKPALRLNPVCGKNVAMDETGHIVTLKRRNPGAICSVEQPLKPGEIIQIDVAPAGTTTWTELMTYVSNNCPEDLELDDHGKNCSLFPLEKIPDPRSLVKLHITPEGEVSYVINGEQWRMDLNEQIDLTEPVYVYFEPLRVKLMLVPTSLQEESDEFTEEILDQCSDKSWPFDCTLISSDESDCDSNYAHQSSESCLPLQGQEDTHDESTELSSLQSGKETSQTTYSRENTISSHYLETKTTADTKTCAQGKNIMTSHDFTEGATIESITHTQACAQGQNIMTSDDFTEGATAMEHVNNRRRPSIAETKNFQIICESIAHQVLNLKETIKHISPEYLGETQRLNETVENMSPKSLEEFPANSALSHHEQTLLSLHACSRSPDQPVSSCLKPTEQIPDDRSFSRTTHDHYPCVYSATQQIPDERSFSRTTHDHYPFVYSATQQIPDERSFSRTTHDHYPFVYSATQQIPDERSFSRTTHDHYPCVYSATTHQKHDPDDSSFTKSQDHHPNINSGRTEEYYPCVCSSTRFQEQSASVGGSYSIATQEHSTDIHSVRTTEEHYPCVCSGIATLEHHTGSSTRSQEQPASCGYFKNQDQFTVISRPAVSQPQLTADCESYSIAKDHHLGIFSSHEHYPRVCSSIRAQENQLNIYSETTQEQIPDVHSSRTHEDHPRERSSTGFQEQSAVGSRPTRSQPQPTDACPSARNLEQLPDVCASTHEGMFEKHIRPHYSTFVNSMEAENVADYLFEFKVINDDQMETVQGEHHPRKKKNRILLDAVKNMPNAVILFKEALEKSGHPYLAKLIHL